jgi:tetratricopeptide (TPR) repeat protein
VAQDMQLAQDMQRHAAYYQEKALRKSVMENHYMVEGAKRIHIKHVPANCPAIHIPQWCLDDEQGCLSRLPHLLTSGDAAGMSHDCIFVVRLNGERSAAAVAPTVRAMEQAFKKVWMVAEDMLEFPLSDLWKMGNHYMVTLMQACVVRHLWQYVVVLPHKGAELERFDAEVMQRRSEDTGKGVLEITLDDTVPHLRPPQKVTCPCPEYPDNKMLKDVGLEMQHTLHRLRMAATCFEQAAQKDPSDAEAWNWLATTQLNLEMYDAAANSFSAANSLKQSAAFLINMGVALQRGGRNQEAVDAYRKGLDLDSNWPEALLNQAYALQDLGRHQEAADAFVKALKAR